MPSAPPKAISAEVVATEPTAADKPMLASLSSELNRSLPDVGVHREDQAGQSSRADGRWMGPLCRRHAHSEVLGVSRRDLLQGARRHVSRRTSGKAAALLARRSDVREDRGEAAGTSVAGPDRLQASTPSPSAVGGPERDGPRAPGPKGCTSERTETAPGQEALDIDVRADRA